jgi:hypothetical protein
MAFRHYLIGLAVLVSVGSLHAQDSGAVNLLPNGSFEFWSQFAPEVLSKELKSGTVYDSNDPLVPTRWQHEMSSGTSLKRSANAHGGKYALSIGEGKGGSGRLSLGRLEVIPGAEYTFGVWIKGSGEVNATLGGQAIEGDQELASVKAQASDQYTLVEGKVTIPRHIRFVTLTLGVSAKSEVLLDDAHISAQLDSPYDADAVLAKKYDRDGHTVMLADFEKDDPGIILETKAHVIKEGRFGRALRIDPPDSASIPLKVAKMSEEGTLEFWLSPDEIPCLQGKGIKSYLSVCSAATALASVNSDTSCSLRCSWRNDDAPYGKHNSVAAGCLSTMRKGQWTHVAISWDKEAWRMYVDGVLSDVQTEGDLKWFGAPVRIGISTDWSGGMWKGAIDEIRVSDIKRYGPIVPKGAKVAAMPKGLDTPPVAAAPTKEESAKPKVDLAAERAKLIDTLPPSQPGAAEDKPTAAGDYVYEAASLKPLVTDGLLKLDTDKEKPAPGLTTALIGQAGYNGWVNTGGAYWKLGDIKPGKYWLGLWYQSNPEYNKTIEASVWGGPLTVYVNGRIAQNATISDPVQVSKGVWFAEIQSLAAEPLKPGDEIAVTPKTNSTAKVLRLFLHSTQPRIGAGRYPLNFEGFWANYNALTLTADTFFVGKTLDRLNQGDRTQYTDGPGDLGRDDKGRGIALCVLANPLPVPLTVDYHCAVKGYFLQTLGQDTERITLQAHQRITRRVAFDITPDDTSYSIKATIHAVNPPDFQKTLGWPRGDEVAFFPGLRQQIPWADAFNYWVGQRLAFFKPVPGLREVTSLGGQWQSAFTTSLTPAMPPPADLKYTNRGVPFQEYQCSVENIDPRPHGMYLSHTFELPADAASRTYRIVLASLSAEGTLYVNGMKLGNVRGGGTPLVADITPAAKPGKNELVVVLRDILSIMDQAYVNPKSPTASGLYLDAPALGGFMLGEVTLESSPRVAAEETLVTTSFRDKTLRVHTALTSHQDQRGKFTVKALVLDAKETRLDLGQKEVTLEPGKPQDLTFEKPWPDAHLWSPKDPYLYVLAVETRDADGKVIDREYERFGFRETWIDGPNVMLNGIAIKVQGFTCGTPHSYVGDALLARGSHGNADYYDEFGYLSSEQLSDITNTSSKHNVERDVFWETAAKNILAGAKRKQNHPSIIAWDLSNEWLGFLGYGGGDPMLGAKRFKKLSDTLKAQDPTRWTFFNGDGDLQGMHDVFSTHYMYPQPRKEHLDAYMPDYAFWRPLDTDFKAGEDVMVCPNQNWAFKRGREVLWDSECLWKVGRQQPPGFTQFVGEEDVISPAIDACSGPVAWLWKQFLDGHRDLGVFTVSYYGTVASTIRDWRLQMFLMPDTSHHGFAGQTITRKFSLHNDVFHKAAFALNWRLVSPSGEVFDKGRIARDMEAGDLQRGDLIVKLPKVDQRTTCTLDLQLEADGKFIYGEDRDIDVWPAPQAAADRPLMREVVLYDPSGKTAELLKREGVKFNTLEGIGEWNRKDANCLFVIGEDALTTANAADLAKLEPFVDAGGNVLILAQKVTPLGLPANTILEPREWVSQAFVRVGDHPILKGVTSWDLHFWSPDRVTSYGAYSKPEGGAVVPLVDSGSAIGMEWVQLMEMYRGKGMYLLCQLPLVSKCDQEPMARELLVRSITYAAGKETYQKPTARMKAVVKMDSELERRLRDLGVAYDVVPADAPVGGSGVVFADASALTEKSTIRGPEFQKALSQGATLVVAGASPEDSSWLTALAGKSVQVTVPRYHMWEGRGYRDGVAPVTAGLSQCDLYYKIYGGGEGDGGQAEDPSFMVEPLQDYSVRVEGGRELVFPGALVEVAVGKGRLLIDQRRWFITQERLAKQGTRQASALAMGLGVTVAPAVKPRELPRGVTYKTLDLRPLANRALMDDVPDDGKGGFTDQGPDADLRDFPTGKHSFHGVPFDIGQNPKSCIVLASNKRPGAKDMPQDATIPVGFTAQGLVFLHTMAYSGHGLVGAYQVQYGDGTTTDILLYGEENIRDWVENPGPFAREKGTTTTVAWTSSCKMWPVIAVYQMLWVNPRPQVAIKSVRFHNPKMESVPVLLGLTAAVDVGQDQEAAQRTAKAKDQLAQALAAISAKDDAKARALLKQAIQNDPTLWDAHRALADLCERAGDDNASLQVYRDWADAGAIAPLPYNRVGGILEKRKDYKGALDAYTRSLKVEWNQPPIIEAKSRLEKLVNQK